jgi:transketolase
MRGAVRLAALMELPVTYVWTHDSIGLGEDGPTHQPVEHLWALRAIPHLAVVRPGDANEVVAAWKHILENPTNPSALALSRQNLPVVDRSNGLASADGVAKGGYVIAEADGDPQVILIATGSELQIALAAREQLQAGGAPTRVVSMPCVEWFEEQDSAYREQVLPHRVKARVSVEAGVTFGWRQYVGDSGVSIGVDHFGASADYQRLYEEFGLTAERTVAAARTVLDQIGAARD